MQGDLKDALITCNEEGDLDASIRAFTNAIDPNNAEYKKDRDDVKKLKYLIDQ